MEYAHVQCFHLHTSELQYHQLWSGVAVYRTRVQSPLVGSSAHSRRKNHNPDHPRGDAKDLLAPHFLYRVEVTQTAARTCIGVNTECLWELRSIIVSNEQFVSYYGIRHIMKQNHWEVFTKKFIHKFQCIPLQM